MTLAEIKNMVMFQTNNDADDLGDFLPYLNDYINEGYDRLVKAWCGEHVGIDSDVYSPLKHDKSQPELPDWTHKAIADWATWLVYRNGNSNKQSRGMAFRNSFEELLMIVKGLTDAQKGFERTEAQKAKQYIYNIPR
jgi:hypothetical protein